MRLTQFNSDPIISLYNWFAQIGPAHLTKLQIPPLEPKFWYCCSMSGNHYSWSKQLVISMQRQILFSAVVLLSTALPSWSKDKACSDGMNERQQTAAQVHILKTELVVGALSCKTTDQYNTFVERYRSELLSTYNVLSEYFPNQSSLEEYKSATANSIAQRSLEDIRSFCNRTSQKFSDLLSYGNVNIVQFAQSDAGYKNLGKCKSPEAVAAAWTGSLNWNSPTPAENDDKICSDLGFRKKTTAFANCRLRLLELRTELTAASQMREAQEREARSAREQRRSEAATNLAVCLLTGVCGGGSPQTRTPSVTTRTYIMNGYPVTCTATGQVTNCH